MSNKDKSFDNIEMLEKALRASNLLSIVDGSRKPPDVTTRNKSGYTAEAIMTTIKADRSRTLTVIAEDDYYKYYADSKFAFTFMISMVYKDMYHMLSEAIKDEEPTKVFKVIQEHFKGGKNHHIESAKRKLNAHRIGPDIEREISRLLVLVSELEVAQKMEMPESQKFGILRNIISYEERPHMRNLFGIASYMKENFYNTVIKISEEWDTIPTDKQAPMAASMAPQTVGRICFKFQTNECVRLKCPFIHKIMSELERKDQKYIAKLPGKKNFTGKPRKGISNEKKFNGKPDLRNNNSKGTNGMHNNIPLTKEHQVMLGEGEAKPTPSNPRGFSKRQLTVLSFFKE